MDQALVTENVNLAHKIANSYHCDADGHSAALLGLCEAADRFDPAKQVKFSTFATWYVKMRVLEYKIRNERLVRIGNSDADRKLYYRLAREASALRAQGIEVDAGSIAERLDVSTDAAERMIGRMSAPEVSLDRSYDLADGTGRTLHEKIASQDPGPDVMVQDKHDRDQMLSVMVAFEGTLDPIDMAIWNNRIASEDPLTLDATAKLISAAVKPITRQAIFQRENKIRVAFETFARDRLDS